MHVRRLKYRLAFLIFAMTATEAFAQNWPQFRGPNGRGVSTVAAPTTWNLETGENVKWLREVPGLGHSSPIVWNNCIYVATAVRPGAKAELKVGVYGDGDSYKEREPHHISTSSSYIASASASLERMADIAQCLR